MSLSLCSTACNPKSHLEINAPCPEKFRDETISHLIAVTCYSDPLATAVFDNADGGAGDAAFLSLLNAKLAGFAEVLIMPVVEYEFPEPEVTERKFSTCKMAKKFYHSQRPSFTVNLVLDAADTTGISGSNSIGRHQTGTLEYLENASLALLMAQKHVYYAVTCDGRLFWLGYDNGDTAPAFLATVTPVSNADDPMRRYNLNTVVLESEQWIKDPKYWTPRAILNSTTLAGLTALKTQLGR